MKALELADKLDGCTNFYGESSLWYDHEASDAVSAAADELRRLAEVNEEMLVALKELVAQNETSFFADSVSSRAMKNARAAIIKAKEQQ